MNDDGFDFDQDSDYDKIKNMKKSAGSTPMLDMFGRDLTKLAKEGKIDPVIGREDEIEKTIQILSKKNKNNPILVGEPGTGKTAIVEGIALRIFEKKIDRSFFNKRLIEINLTSIIAGTKFRGQFEERMDELLKEVKSKDNIIIFIDEIHTVVGAGNASGGMDVGNIIKPALARGELRCIGATTFSEYKKYIESDSALERRFRKVSVLPPTKDETIYILKSIKEKFEKHHMVLYSDEVISACVEYADRYISDRYFPDKAIDFMDEVGARVKLNSSTPPEAIKNMEIECDSITTNKEKAARSQNYEKAASLRDKQKELQDNIESAYKKWEEELENNKVSVTLDDLAKVISKHTGIPVEKLTNSEKSKLIYLENDLKSMVVGQHKAVEKVSDAIRRSRVGIHDPTKPIGSFLFLGPTGTGKTLLCKSLAKILFNSEDAIIRVDMSEYQDKSSVSKLIGSPPGYIGYDEKGQFTERVKNRPYSIVLLDEIEKAHPDVLDILLQLLDDGRLTDATGTEVNFKNTIIIMTSNIGTNKIFKKEKVGFSSSTYKDDEDVEALVIKELEGFLKPEMINRLDEIIVFNPLTEDDVLKITSIQIDILKNRMHDLGYTISVTDGVKAIIAKEGYDKKFGARPLKRVIRRLIENPISSLILKDGLKKNIQVKLLRGADKKIIITSND